MKVTLGMMGALALSSVSASPAWAEGEDCTRYHLGRPAVRLSELGYEVLYHYRQLARKDVDVVGDFALARLAKETPKKIAWSLQRKEAKLDAWNVLQTEARECSLRFFGIPLEEEQVPEREHPAVELFENPAHVSLIEGLPISSEDRERLLRAYHTGKLQLEGREPSIRTDETVRAFLQVMLEESRLGIQPQAGAPHNWSQEFLKRYKGKFLPYVMFPKLLVALSRGETAKYMVTGTENALEAWLVAQPYRSVALADMFRSSYRLNNGDVYLTLLTVENLLAQHWREKDRDLLPSTLRLKPLINHLGKDGDLFGAWYHLFGAMLYGYAKGSLQAWTITAIESAGSRILSRFEAERQEDFINSRGALVGGRLRKAMKRKRYETVPFAPGALKESYYLHLNEDFSKRLLKAARAK